MGVEVFDVICTFQSSQFFDRLSMHFGIVDHFWASALTTADRSPPSWNRITDRTPGPPFGKRDRWTPLGCLHQIYHGPKEMLMVPSLGDTGNMGPVWGGLILKNLKQNPAFRVSFELKIRPKIFINFIQHFYLASTILQVWDVYFVYHVRPFLYSTIMIKKKHYNR